MAQIAFGQQQGKDKRMRSLDPQRTIINFVAQFNRRKAIQARWDARKEKREIEKELNQNKHQTVKPKRL